MTGNRASIFDAEDAEVDLSDFAPKSQPDPSAPAIDQVRAVSEQANFPSREARPLQERVMSATVPAPANHAISPARYRRRRRSPRSVQLSIKATPQGAELLSAIADKQEWTYGETLDRALAALQRELASQQAAQVIA